ncbi:hypothetical protein EDC01DRAFT_651127 [Geopyxis carbonaria]|nr:hypothetical protein EDC01DRAFT_651127 [Geopyxis carbonaria]
MVYKDLYSTELRRIFTQQLSCQLYKHLQTTLFVNRYFQPTKMRFSILTSLALCSAAAVHGLAIRQTACTSGGPEEVLNFDSSAPTSLTLKGYTVGAATSTDHSIQGLQAHSSPNIAFSPKPDNSFPPVIAGSGISSSDAHRTFTLKRFWVAGPPGFTGQLLLLPTKNGQTSAFVKTGGASGTMTLIDVSDDTSGAYSGLSSFSIRAESSGFVKAHAIDDFTIVWDC